MSLVHPWSRLLALVLGAAGGALTAHAHHSIAAVYDSTKRLTVEGVVTEFQFVNPHPFLLIEGAGEHEGQIWRLEMDNRIELSDIGIAADTFKAGDRVVVYGSGSRTEPQRLYLYRLDRASDGFRYEQVGSRPRINLPAPR